MAHTNSLLTNAEDELNIASLGELVKASNLQLRESAIDILLNRAMSGAHLPYILKCAGDLTNDRRDAAVTALSQLTKTETNRRILIHAGALEILCNVVMAPNQELSTYRYAVICIYRLIAGSEPLKKSVVSYGIIPSLIDFLTSCPTHNNDLKYWSLLILHQLTLEDSMHNDLLSPKHNLVMVLGHLTRLTFGNSNMQKLALHSLVRLLGSMPNEEVIAVLSQLNQVGVVGILASCAKTDDVELSSWAVFLIHEFVVKDIGCEKFLQIKELISSLGNLLSSEDTLLPRIILRIFKTLGMKSTNFQLSLRKKELLKRIVQWIEQREDEECQYWALSLVHDLLAHRESHSLFWEVGGVDAVNDVTYYATPNIVLYVADIYAYLISNEENATHLINSDILECIINFLKHKESDIQYAGGALIVSLASISNKIIAHLVHKGVIGLLTFLILKGTRENTQLVAAKALYTLARKESATRGAILSEAVDPLLTKLAIGTQILQRLLMKDVGSPGEVENEGRPVSAGTPRSPTRSPREQVISAALDDLATSPTIGVTGYGVDRQHGHGEEETTSDLEMNQELLDVLEPQLTQYTILHPDNLSTPPSEQFSSPLSEHFTSPTKPNSNLLVSHIKSVCVLLECLSILLGGHRSFHKIVTKEGVELGLDQFFGDNKVLEIATACMDLVVLPMLDEEEAVKEKKTTLNHDRAQEDEDNSRALSVDVSVRPPSRNGHPGDHNNDHDDLVTDGLESDSESLWAGEQWSLKNARIELAQTVMKQLVKEKFFVLLVILMHEKESLLLGDAVRTLGISIHREGADLELYRLLPYAFDDMVAILCAKESLGTVRLYAEAYLANLANHTHARKLDDDATNAGKIEPQYVELSRKDKTPSLLLSANRRSVRNDSWGFESIRGNVGVSRSDCQDEDAPLCRCWAYEVQIWTEGIVQVGWATESCKFDPEGGTGVGDDKHSYAYDGHRSKKWHGVFARENEYGRSWSKGDMVTVCIDLNAGHIRFYLNGEDLGVAFDNLDLAQTYYPAISLAAAQECTVSFGDAMGQLTYCPKGYQPISVVKQSIERWKSVDSISEEELNRLQQIMSNPGSTDTLENVNEEDGQDDLVDEDDEEVTIEEVKVDERRERQSTNSDNVLWDSFFLGFYYEVTIGIRGLDERRPCIQIGIRDHINVYAILPYKDSLYFVYCHHSPTDRNFYHAQLESTIMTHYRQHRHKYGNGVRVVYDEIVEELRHLSLSDLDDAETDKDKEDSIKIVGVVYGQCLGEGDKIGIGVDPQRLTCGFILQNQLVAPLVPLRKSGMWIPYLRDIPRFKLNFGQDAFWGVVEERVRRQV